MPTAAEVDDLLVACLCAEWCGACRAFAADFAAVAHAWPAARFVWIDIEDHPEVLGDDDIETFPTLMIADAHGAAFYGAIEPRQSTLQALVAQTRDATTGRPPPNARASSVERLVRSHIAELRART